MHVMHVIYVVHAMHVEAEVKTDSALPGSFPAGGSRHHRGAAEHSRSSVAVVTRRRVYWEA